jgi:hypothetical protein
MSPRIDSMSNTKEAIEYYLRRLHDGDSAFFGLLEPGATAIPQLVDAYRVEADGSCRAFLVHVIWEYRDPAAISFLAEALGDEFPEVWKVAIDGLVAMPCDESLRNLRAALNAVPDQCDAAQRREWIQEAIEQVSEILYRM